MNARLDLTKIVAVVALALGLSAAGCGGDSGVGPNLDAGLTDGRGADGPAVVDGCANAAALRATCSQTLPARFDQSTVLEAGCYLAATSPTIASGVTLTLSPGVTIIFAAGTDLGISADQVLLAQGTAEHPICLTGATAERGAWTGLRFDGTANVSKLDYVTVEYAGNTSLTHDADSAAIKATADSRGVRLELTNSTLRESAGWGLYLTGSAKVTAFANNVLTKNTLGPVSVDGEVTGVLDAASSYAGNDVDQIHVRPYHLSTAATWAITEVPYFLAAGLRVLVEWTLAPGVTLIMDDGTGLTIDGDAAALTAVGTAEKPILITGATKTRGSWGALVFSYTQNPKNQLSYVTVEYAGSGVGQDDVADVTMTADSHGVRLSMSHCTLRESKGHGFAARGGTLPVFEANTMTHNTLGPASADSEVVHQLTPSSTYTGNDVDEIAVHAYSIQQAVTWEDLGVPYNLDFGLHVEAHWTIAPGVTLIMGQHALISVSRDEYALDAVGTAAKPITFTAAEPTKGFWNGINFDNTLGANRLDYVTVEYGGGNPAPGEVYTSGDSHGVAVTITNSTIRHSNTYGLWLGGNFQGTIGAGNSFSDNTSGDVCHWVSMTCQ
ncbi:MAG TPA: hypothetical protein VGQ83_24575 [Polyangia bacterium]|jgi:hypothetical protein